MEFLPKPGQAKCVQIELDPTRIGLRHQVEVGLVGDSKTILTALLPLLKKKDNKFLKKSQERMKNWFELMEERGTREDMPMKPQVVTYTLNKLLNDDAIVSSDSGTIATWTARYVDIRGTMQFSLSGSLATMANGLPYSIGAAVAYPGTAGRVRRRRRRSDNADGRDCHAGEVQAAGQSDRDQEQRARARSSGSR